jgi:hypothetical protein
MVGRVVGVDRDRHPITALQGLELGRPGQGGHHDVGAIPLEPDGHHPWGAVGPVVRQPRRDLGGQQLLGDWVLEEFGSTLDHGRHSLSADRLLELGRQVALTSPQFQRKVTDGAYDTWIRQATDQASQQGINQTPAVLVNGQQVDAALTAQGLLAAVNAANPSGH